jgi:hypothetical protein
MAKEEEVKFEAPEAPAILPDKVKKQWAKAYVDAFRQAQEDSPNDLTTQIQTALREANRTLRVPKLESYEDAMELPEWKVIKRQAVGTELKVVTIDGKKYTFPVPPPAGGDDTRGTGEQKPAAA